MCRWKCGKYSWLLEDIRKIEPFDVKGSQRFYDVDFTIDLGVMIKESRVDQGVLFKD